MSDVIAAGYERLPACRRPFRIDHDHEVDVPKAPLDRHDSEIDLVREQIPERVVLVGEIENSQQCRRIGGSVFGSANQMVGVWAFYSCASRQSARGSLQNFHHSTGYLAVHTPNV